MCCENVFSVQVSTKEFFFTLAAIAAEVSEVSKNGIKKHGILKITKKPRKKQSFFFSEKLVSFASVLLKGFKSERVYLWNILSIITLLV